MAERRNSKTGAQSSKPKQPDSRREMADAGRTTPPLDRTGKRAAWRIAAAAERSYSSRLREVAKAVASLIKGHDKGPGSYANLIRLLNDYADLIAPWSESVARKMLTDVAKANYQMWKRNSQEISAALREELAGDPTGLALRKNLRENIHLIRSIPRKAAERVHELSQEALVTGQRSKTLIKEIAEIGGITERRAKLIARTEVSRANAALTQARAEWVGSEGYIWRTVGDSDVRDAHKHMEGRYVRWSQPPITDMKNPYHAGAGPNCRCTAEPVLPGETIAQVKALRKRPVAE